MSSPITLTAERAIAAPTATVYGIIADYRDSHPLILPPAFSPLVVEEGGVGAGTVVRFSIRSAGKTRRYRTRIDEPEPARRLVESDTLSDTVTTFTVTPEGAGSRVRIETVWRPAGGLMGFLERRLAPRLVGRLYGDELTRLERLAVERAAAAPVG